MDPTFITILTTVIATVVATILISTFSKLINRARDYREWRNSEIEDKLIRNVDTNGGRLKIIKSTIFISHQGQTSNPIDTYENESIGSFDLVTNLLETIQKKMIQGKLRYLMLGGSGTGSQHLW